MKICILLIFSLWYALSDAQTTVTICQTHGLRDWIIFYKSGSDTAVGRRLNDSCTIYDIPVSEPTDLAILRPENTHHLLHLWADPHHKPRYATIDNAADDIIRNDTLPIDRDEEPYRRLEEQWS